MKNRTILGIICIALAVALVFGISPFLSALSSQKIDVVQLNKQITEGKKITEEDVVMVQVGKQGTSKNIITKKEDVVGKYAKTDIYPETNLIPAMLSEKASNADAVLSTLDGNHVAISITVPSFAAALSAKLENGDIVSVVVNEMEDTYIPRELTYVRVITTTTQTGIDQDDLSADATGNESLPATITMVVTPEQAKLLAQYEAKASMHLALVYRGDADTADEYVAKQEKVLEEIAAEKKAAEEAAAKLAEAQKATADNAESAETEDGGVNNG